MEFLSVGEDLVDPAPDAFEHRTCALGGLAQAGLGAGQIAPHRIARHAEPTRRPPDPPSGGGTTAISLATARRLACDASVVLAIDDARTTATSRRKRRISPRLRRARRLRDDGCRFPGCTNRLTDAHHVEHWVDGGATRVANLCSLCRRHHRLVHEHGYRIVAASDGAWEFVRSDGSPVPVADAELRGWSRRVARDDLGTPHDGLLDGATALRAAHDARGLDIDAATAAPRWDGEPVDYGLAVEALLAAASCGCAARLGVGGRISTPYARRVMGPPIAARAGTPARGRPLQALRAHPLSGPARSRSAASSC